MDARLARLARDEHAGLAVSASAGAQRAGASFRIVGGLLLLALLAGVTVAIILTAPPDLVSGNQDRMAGYVTDVLDRGRWIAPRDSGGFVISKPPLYAWVAALATLALGGISQFSLYAPSILATLGAAWLVFLAGRRFWDEAAGLLGALTYLLSSVAATQISTARYDGLFAFTIALAALAAFRSWTIGAPSGATGRGWTWFWIAAAIATMTKGPLGLVLAAAGLVAAFWERGHTERRDARLGHLAGVVCFALIVGGWFWLAWQATGDELVAQMLYGELYTHAVSKGGTPGANAHKPFVYLIVAFAPWSAFTAVALSRLWRRTPSSVAGAPLGATAGVARDGLHGEDASFGASAIARRFERFVACWLLVGLVIFALGSHQRERLIYPLVPPAALLAGRELSRWVGLSPRPAAFAIAGTVAVMWLAGTAFVFHRWRPASSEVRETLAMRQAAEAVFPTRGRALQLVHVDSPFPFRFYLGHRQPLRDPADAALMLQQERAVFVAVRDVDALAARVSGPLHEVFRWPDTGTPIVRIVGNRPRLERIADRAAP